MDTPMDLKKQFKLITHVYIMQELSDLLCIKHQPSHPMMYGLTRLNIKSPCINYYRRRDWTYTERARIKELIVSLVDTADVETKYYKFMTYNRVLPLLAT
jgi:hypothetical protein